MALILCHQSSVEAAWHPLREFERGGRGLIWTGVVRILRLHVDVNSVGGSWDRHMQRQEMVVLIGEVLELPLRRS